VILGPLRCLSLGLTGRATHRGDNRSARSINSIGGRLLLTYLKKFGSVTVLNGHIHQTMQKVEGNVTFHTAAFTAFPQPQPQPQPQPGKGDSPGPMKVPAEQLRSLLGVTDVNYVRGQQALAVLDSSLA